MDDDLYGINDLIGFLDLDDESDEIALRAPPKLRVKSAFRQQQAPAVRTRAPQSIEDSLAMMRVNVESQVSIRDRIKEIAAELKSDQQNQVHYLLPSELVLSRL